MKMKIINMANRMKDAADRKLESMFQSDPVRDDGFSIRVMARLRRQLWVRRLSLPVAIAAGAALSAKPLIQFASALPDIVTAIPGIDLNLAQLPIDSLPQTSTIVWGIVLLASALMAGRMLED